MTSSNTFFDDVNNSRGSNERRAVIGQSQKCCYDAGKLQKIVPILFDIYLPLRRIFCTRIETQRMIKV